MVQKLKIHNPGSLIMNILIPEGQRYKSIKDKTANLKGICQLPLYILLVFFVHFDILASK